MKRGHGFTLMEVMITVAIVAVLAAIAIPNYVQYITRSNRSEARQQLLEGAAFMQRCFTQNNDYRCAVPAGLAQAPATGAPRYNIALATGGAVGSITYTLRATRTPGSAMATDECLNFEVTHDGRRRLEEGGSVSTDATLTARCWER